MKVKVLRKHETLSGTSHPIEIEVQASNEERCRVRWLRHVGNPWADDSGRDWQSIVRVEACRELLRWLKEMMTEECKNCAGKGKGVNLGRGTVRELGVTGQIQFGNEACPHCFGLGWKVKVI